MKTKRGRLYIKEGTTGKWVTPADKPAHNTSRRPPERPTRKQVQRAIEFFKP